ncbi:MAG TPA: ATP-binding protein [Verrucomicrobiae bacterium]|nr:ATP-binding protein [Verrucomicrobiae bacterium]
MLALKQLKAKACRSIVDGPELNFKSGGLFLVGDNGTGKSSYVDAIEKVLTGKCSSLDTGDQGLSWDKQGKHISSKSPPEIQLVITDGNKDFSIALDTSFAALEKPVQALLSAARQFTPGKALVAYQ